MSNPSLPILITERLKLVPMTTEHLTLELELDSDPNVTRYIYKEPPTASMIREDYPQRLQRGAKYGFWVGLLYSEPIGWFLLEPPLRDDQGISLRQAELGYRLLPRFWRHGLATEGSLAVMQYAFVDLDLERVFAETMAVNTASRATMAKLGMQHIRTFWPHFDDPIEGTEEGEVEFAITREQWRRKTQD